MPVSEPLLHERAYAAFSRVASTDGWPLSIDDACQMLGEPQGEIRVAYGFGVALAIIMRENMAMRYLHPRQSKQDIARYMKDLLRGIDEYTTKVSQETPLVAWNFGDFGPSIILDNAHSGYATRLVDVKSFTRAEYGKDGKKYTCIYVGAEQKQSSSVENLVVCECTNKGIAVTQFLPPSVYNEKTRETNCRAIKYLYSWDIKNGKVLGATLNHGVLIGSVHIENDGLIAQFRNPFSCLVKENSSLGLEFNRTDSIGGMTQASRALRLTIYDGTDKYTFKPVVKPATEVLKVAPQWLKRAIKRLTNVVHGQEQKHSIIGTLELSTYINLTSAFGINLRFFQPEDRVSGLNYLVLDETSQWILELIASSVQPKIALANKQKR